jgi:large subunit ribosomal protein L6
MSRIGKVPVLIPSGVDVSIEDQNVRVKGPKGEVSQEFSPLTNISKSDDSVIVKPADNSRAAQANYGTARSIISNMVKGVTEPFTKDLLIEGVGFSGNN